MEKVQINISGMHCASCAVSTEKELKKVKSQKNWKDIYHIIILPTYKESEGIIEETVRSIIKSDYPKEKMIVVLAVEQRAGEIFEETAREKALPPAMCCAFEVLLRPIIASNAKM